MTINISGLSEGIHTYQLSALAAELELPPNFSGNATANITIDKSIHQIVTTVKASAKGIFICDRCTDEFTDDIEVTFTSVYSWENGEPKEEDDDFHLMRNDDTMIDLSAAVREYFILSVPVKMLCKKKCTIPDYPNTMHEVIDSRWEKLQTILQSEKN